MMRDVLKESSPAQIVASAEIEPGEITGRVKMRGPRGGKTRGRDPGRKRLPSIAEARAARAQGIELPLPKIAERIPCRGTPIVVCVSVGLDDADELDRQAKAAGMTRSSYLRHLVWKGAK